jgi:2-polyprenyl-3-methyl-5-hydroxy-6-metoxy-1,4-benzoquinol methylase
VSASASPTSHPGAATWQEVSCPLCGTRLRRADIRWRKDGFDIVRCPSCTLVFRAVLPTTAEIEAIYGREYFERAADDSSGQGYLDYLQDADEHRLNACRRLDMIERLAPNRGRLLDVGAAAGFFGDEAKRRGWSVQGIDVSPFMTGHARTTLGLDVRTGLFQAIENLDRYELVTMWDYIEHSIDPVGDVRRAAEALQPGGLLALSTGDIDTLVAKVSGSRWHLLTPNHHNFYFSTSTLGRLLRDAGLEVVSARHTAGYFSDRYIVHKLRTMLPASKVFDRIAARTSESKLGERAVPVSLGDIVTIVARKPAAR